MTVERMKGMTIEGWVAVCKPPEPDIVRLMGWKGAALFFKTRKDAREFVHQWQDDTENNAPIKVERAAIKVGRKPR